jgi:hypothetical protein
MKRYWLLGLILGLTACAATATESNSMTEPTSAPTTNSVSSLPNLGPAPELTNEVWLNADAPLRLADLGGKVVAIDMWTFG